MFTAGGNTQDYYDDQQTGIPEADIVGTSDDATAGFYRAFNDNGDLSNTDGTLLFRVRLGSDNPDNPGPGTYNNYLFIGIDANLDGAMDLFIGVDGKTDQQNKIYSPGTGANTSPSTTSITVPTPQVAYNHDATNYSFSTVGSIDPVQTDLDADGDPDYFLSLALPFADVVAEMSRIAGISITDSTPLQMVVGTANQDNAMNQDIGGLNGGTKDKTSWTDLGTFTDPVTIDPTPVDPSTVPEPSTVALFGIGLAFMVGCRRWFPSGKS